MVSIQANDVDKQGYFCKDKDMDNGNTYTYTARNAYDPDKVVTFTLVDHHMQVSFSELAEKVAKVAASEDKQEEIKQQLQSQVEPLKMKVMEQIGGPYHLGDISADLEDDHLKLKGWNRVLGMRLTPYAIEIGRVDNPDAAEAFVNELQRRKETAPDAGPFVGPLDYWMGWAAIIMLLVVLFRWPRRKS